MLQRLEISILLTWNYALILRRHWCFFIQGTVLMFDTGTIYNLKCFDLLQTVGEVSWCIQRCVLGALRPANITWVTCSAYRLRWRFHGVLVCGNKRVRLKAACVLILILSMVRHWWVLQVIQGLYWWCWRWCWRWCWSYRCMILNSCTNKLRMIKLMLMSHEQRLSSSYFSDLNKLMLTS